MEKLTDRQKEILDTIKKFIAKNGFPPTVREIGKALNLSSPATTHFHLSKLESKGYIKKDKSKNRTLELLVPNEYVEEASDIATVPLIVTITAGNKKQSIVAGKDGRFSLRVTDGYQIVLDCNGVRPSNEQNDPDGSITYTFLAINRNITCNVNAQAIDQNNGN